MTKKIIYITESISELLSETKIKRNTDILCPHIFNPNSEMKKEIKGEIIEYAEEFFNSLEFDWLDYEEDVIDIWLIGSCADYTWSQLHSKMELQLLLKYDEITTDRDSLEHLLDKDEEEFNGYSDKIIVDFEVEFHAQDYEEEINSEGIYSVMKRTWIKKPEKGKSKINYKQVQKIIHDIENRIAEIMNYYRNGEYKKAHYLSEKLSSMVNQMRRTGLKKDNDNRSKYAAYKDLIKNGDLKKLNFLRKNSFDKSTSGEEGKKSKKDIKKTTKKSGNKKDKDDDGYTDGINYIINGKEYPSLRTAEKETGIAKSTLEYRVNSDSDKWGSYKKTT